MINISVHIPGGAEQVKGCCIGSVINAGICQGRKAEAVILIGVPLVCQITARGSHAKSDHSIFAGYPVNRLNGYGRQGF